MIPRTRSSYERKMIRYFKREAKAAQYRAAALSGGGKREVARRAWQIFCQRLLDPTTYYP